MDFIQLKNFKNFSPKRIKIFSNQLHKILTFHVLNVDDFMYCATFHYISLNLKLAPLYPAPTYVEYPFPVTGL